MDLYSQEIQEKKKVLQNQPQTIKENGNRSIYINNNFKCKWIKYSNQKTQTGTNKTCIYAVYKNHFKPQDTYRLKVRGCKNIFHANRKQNKTGVAILISDKIDLKIFLM